MIEKKHTVLVVDDDPEIIDLLKDLFRTRNLEIIATSDPLTVVDKLRNFAIKLMLLDIKMRKLDGFKVLDKIRQSGLVLPPTIIITGFLPKYQDQLKAYGISLNDVVTKPFSLDNVEGAINRKLGQQIVTSEVGSEYETKLYENNRCHVAFIEDEEDLVKDLSCFFQERNYKVSSYTDGTSGLENLRKNSVDILFVDIKLPGIQGDQIITELAKMPKPPYMIPMTADPIPEEMWERLKKLGCKEFIEKPFDVVELIERVKTIAVEKGLLG